MNEDCGVHGIMGRTRGTARGWRRIPGKGVVRRSTKIVRLPRRMLHCKKMWAPFYSIPPKTTAEWGFILSFE